MACKVPPFVPSVQCTRSEHERRFCAESFTLRARHLVILRANAAGS